MVRIDMSTETATSEAIRFPMRDVLNSFIFDLRWPMSNPEQARGVAFRFGCDVEQKQEQPIISV